jgi:hypothetical protein
MPGLVPGIHVFRTAQRKTGMAGPSPAMTRRESRDPNVYSIAAWSGASCCLRSAALVEPIMIASGIAHIVNSITIW